MTGLEAGLLTLLAAVSSITLFLQLGLIKRVLPALERAERLLAADPLSPDSGLQIGATVPEFTVLDRLGDSISLSRLTQGGSLVVLFVADDCPSCVHLMDELVDQGWHASMPLLVLQTDPGRELNA